MSAVGLVPQDTAGLSAFIGRKTPSAAQDDDPDADFSAALAQTADASPASTSLSPATPADASLPNSGDEIWRRLSAFSDEATAPQTAVEANAPSPQAQGDLLAAVTGDPSPALPAPLSKAQLAERAGWQDARVPPKTDAAPAAAPAPMTVSDTAPARPSLAASSSMTSSLPPASLAPASIAPENFSRAPDKTAPKAPPTSDRTAPKAEKAVSTSCPSNPPASCADQGLVALTVSPPPAEKSASPLASPSSEQDSVARIGAALAFSGGAQKPAASDPDLKQARYSEAEPPEGAATAIHVVAQQTWLPPVSPVFSPGLSREDAADRVGPEAPQAVRGKPEDAAGGKTEDSTNSKDVAANSQLPTASAPEKTPQTPFAGLLSPGGANLAPGRGELPKPAAASAATSTPDDSRRSLMAAPRRDLEITLAPKELGGLEVRMKSAGDRLELAFVADRGETARLISDKSAALTSQLYDAGIGLGGIDISSAASGPGGSGDAPPNSSSANSHPAPQRQNSSGRDRQDRENETNDQIGDARPRGERGFYL